MENSNVTKARLLGMPFGTANARLKKKLLFHLAGKLNMLDCFRCHKTIELLEEFSVEHTISWLYAHDPVETFFDVEKIAFSHLDCNVAAGTKPNKILSPEGMSWCSTCKQDLPVEDFTKGRRNGLQVECRKCRTLAKAGWRAKYGRH